MVEKHYVAWWVGGVFALLAALVSFGQMRYHMIWNTQPELRKHVLRILLMVPVYALESFMGLRFKGSALYMDLLRECYEAFVIYSFFRFLVEVLGGEHRVVALLRDKDQTPHVFPFCMISPWAMGPDFFHWCKIGTLQYCAVKPFTAALTFILKPTGAYEEGKIASDNAYPYFVFIDNATQVWAMYCLILFYLAMQQELESCNPIPKFLCVKSVVFFTFWQSVLIAILVEMDIITATDTYSTDNVATGLQDFIVCIEMLVAAIAHHYAFNAKEFYRPDGKRPLRGSRMISTMLSVVNVSDVYLKDIPSAMRNNKRGGRQAYYSPPSSDNASVTEPLESREHEDDGVIVDEVADTRVRSMSSQQQHGAEHPSTSLLSAADPDVDDAGDVASDAIGDDDARVPLNMRGDSEQ